MDGDTWLTGAILVAALAGAVWYDIRERRVPNAITLGSCAAALLARAVGGADPFLTGLAGMGMGLGVGFVLFAARALGAGDGKLLMAVGALLGPEGFVVALLLAGLVGGAMALATAWRHGAIVAVLVNVRDLVVFGATFGRRGAVRSVSSVGVPTVPYAVAIAAGATVAWINAGGIL